MGAGEARASLLSCCKAKARRRVTSRKGVTGQKGKWAWVDGGCRWAEVACLPPAGLLSFINFFSCIIIFVVQIELGRRIEGFRVIAL